MKMNIYKKLQTCRTALQKTAIKKSGINRFAGYTYYELGDFLPTIQSLFDDNGLCGVVSFSKELATLTIYDSDDSSLPLIFTSPMAEANLKGCHPIQNLGAVETYQRRYLWITAMEISETDEISKTVKQSDKELKQVVKEIYGDDDFNKNLPAWTSKIEDGSITGDKLIAMIETKFTLSDDQKTVLKNA
jgi:ERF superfamily